jgi:hypothetical protein
MEATRRQLISTPAALPEHSNVSRGYPTFFLKRANDNIVSKLASLDCVDTKKITTLAIATPHSEIRLFSQL